MNIVWQYDRIETILGTEVRTYHARHDRKLRCIISGPEVGLNFPEDPWHISFSHPDRDPSTEEIDSAIMEFLPAGIDLVQLPLTESPVVGRKPALHFCADTDEHPDAQVYSPTSMSPQ